MNGPITAIRYIEEAPRYASICACRYPAQILTLVTDLAEQGDKRHIGGKK